MKRSTNRATSRAGKARRILGSVLCSCCVFVLWCGAPACALNPSTPLGELSGQAWVLENGLPQDTVQALAQTSDGYLWVGTEAGLARFDGSGFQVFDRTSAPALPANDVHCLLAAGDTLWVGTSQGVARWQDGKFTVFTTANGLPANDIRALSLDDRGEVVVSTAAGEVSIAGSRVAPMAAGNGGRAGATYSASDVLFIAKLPDGRTAQATRSSVELTEHGGSMRLSVGKELPGSRIQALLADREGSLWIGTNAGLVRVGAAGRVQSFPATAPLAAASVLALLEDREGNLWVGTEAEGLHILRDRRFFTFDTRNGLAGDNTTTVVEDRTGTLWVGTLGAGLSAVRLQKNTGGSVFPEAHAVRTYTVRDGLASNVILSLAAAPEGNLWVGTPDGLSRIRAGNIRTFTSADGLPDDFIRSVLVDEDGSLWIGTRHGLAHLTQGAGEQIRMRIFTQANGLGSDLVGAMARDTHGDLWVATLGGLSRLHNGTIVNFTTANGLESDVATTLLPRPDGTLLIGTENHGLDEWDGQSFSEAVPSDLDRTTIHAILDDHRGRLWFATASGIARCDWKEHRAGAGGSGSQWIEFGTADGLRSAQMAANSHPSAWRSSDGNLWFATPKGLVEVEPAHFRLNTLPPPVVLERFAVDDREQPLHGNGPALKIPAGRVHFEFDYAGLSFVAPQKVRYRYMLQGFDQGWTEAGGRRAAYYTNIPPGRYDFVVEAANNDGVWNTAGAKFSFDLQRHFYQTIWFYALVLAALAGSILLLLRRRLRLAEREFRAVLGERSRIAREIHDTLAQGYVGVSVQLELLAELLRLKKLDQAARQLDTTREYVREGLADARQSIWALRTHDAGEETLPVKLRGMVEQAGGGDLGARFSVSGAYRPLPPATEREMLRVAQEAIHNVKNHAAAKQMLVRLEYEPEAIVLEVQDDGRGGAALHKHAFVPGHYGLTGMRERAEGIGGSLEIESEPGVGTTVRLRVPATAEAREHAEEPL